MATTAKNVSKLKSTSVEQLSNDVEALKSDISSLMGTIKDLVGEGRETAVAQTKKKAEMVKSEAVSQAEHLQEVAGQFASDARDKVQEKPGTALMIAAAVGMVFGFMTARK